jgi:hypothetical protein
MSIHFLLSCARCKDLRTLRRLSRVIGRIVHKSAVNERIGLSSQAENSRVGPRPRN